MPKTNNWKSRIAELLSAGRIKIGSQAKLAALARVSDRLIGQLETETIATLPRPTTIARLAIAVNADPGKWLKITGQTLPNSKIDALRESLATNGNLLGHEPAETIKRTLRDELHSKTAPFEPAESIKRTLRDEINSKLAELQHELKEIRRHSKTIGHDELKQEFQAALLKAAVSPAQLQRKLEEDYKPAKELRQQIMEAVEERIAGVRKLISDLDARVSQLASWQRELMDQVRTVFSGQLQATIEKQHE